MASYQAKQRDPLFDTKMQAAIERRGKELIGIGLVFASVLLGLALFSFSPDDPSILNATDAPIQNILGRFGATLAAPAILVVGLGAWAIPTVLGVWGIRFITHRGEERNWRMVFFVVMIVVGMIYAATLTPYESWPLQDGMGGIMGDTILAGLLHAMPMGLNLSVKLISILSFVGLIAISLFALGFDRAELARFGRFLLVGLILTYANLMTLMGRGATGAYAGAKVLKSKHDARRENRAMAAEMDVHAPAARVMRAAEPAPQTEFDDALIETEETEKPGLLARVGATLRRAPEPELVEPEAIAHDAPNMSEDHIKARIADVVRNRARKAGSGAAMRSEPPLQGSGAASSVASAAVARRRGPQPLIAQTAPKYAPPPQPLEETQLDDAPVAPPLHMDETAPEYPALNTQHVADSMPVDLPDMDLTTQTAAAAHAAPIPVAEAPRAVVQHPPKRVVKPSKQAAAEAQPQLQFDQGPTVEYELPPLSLLASPNTVERYVLSDDALEQNARMLENVLEDYGVKGDIVSVRPGPVVTMYELEPAPGLKASRVIGLADDIARSMSALSARVSTVPGRSVIGIELPNDKREMVSFREMLSSRDYGDGNHRLPLALGKDIGGEPVVANLAKMPHLLIAGTTGSGKSVAINTMILSLLYKLTPEECRLIMIDPKMLELSVYDGIPHLLSPVVTDPKKAVVALKWTVGEMEDRYRKMSKMGVRNIEGYNSRVRDAQAKGEMFSRTVQTGFDDETGDPIFETEEFAPELLPFIVVIVDEMADLMMVAGKEIEACIQRLAQMARASGIHLIMATQRPSVDVITGTIKANFPTRISFQVTGKIDSRTILGEQGAEQLLGMGDMLYMAGGSKITRVHGPFCSDEEVEEIVNHLKAYGPPDYKSGVIDGPSEDKETNIDAVLGLGGNTNGEDALYDQAVAIVIKDRKCSTSYIQRKLSIGYNKAARLVEQMEDEGVVSSANHVGKREILVPDQQ